MRHWFRFLVLPALLSSFACSTAQAQIALGAIETRLLGAMKPAHVSELRRLQGLADAKTGSIVQAAEPAPGEIQAATQQQPSNALLNRVVKSNFTYFAYDVATGLVVPNVTMALSPLRHKINSGGHDHDATSRPKGELSRYSGNTGATGYELIIEYTSPQVSGTVYSDASCTGPNGFRCFDGYFYSYTTKVPDLQSLGGATTYDLVGSTATHTSNHWGTSSFISSLQTVANNYFLKYEGSTQPKLAINDLSLEHGGLFDVSGNWATPHREHRIGVVGDLRVVPVGRIATLKRMLRDAGIVGTVLIHAPPDPPHWHIREYNSGE